MYKNLQSIIDEENLADSSLNDSFHDTILEPNESVQLQDNSAIKNNSVLETPSRTLYIRPKTPTQTAIRSNIKHFQQTVIQSNTLSPASTSTPIQIPVVSGNMSDHALTVAYAHAKAYMNLFSRSNVDKWFDNCVVLFTGAQVPEATYLFEILTVSNSHLPIDKQIEWSNTANTADTKQKILLAFQISNEEKIKKVLDPNSWKSKTFKTQLKEMREAFGTNYGLLKEMLLKRFPMHVQTMAYTKLQTLEATASITQENRLNQLVEYIDDYNIQFPMSKEASVSAINMVQHAWNDPMQDQKMHLQNLNAQKEEIVQSITERVISSIQALQVDNKKLEEAEPKKNWNNNKNDRKDNQRNKGYGQRQNYGKNNGQNYGNRYNNAGNNNRRQNNNYQNSNRNQNSQRQYSNNGNYSGNNQNSRNERPYNICADHMAFGQNYRSNKCQSGCRYHPSKICYGHYRFGDNAWSSRCEPFCRRFQEQKN